MAKYIGCFEIFRCIAFASYMSAIAATEFKPQCSQKRQLMLHTAENRALKNFAYSKKSVGSCVICGRECSMDEHCKSFNVYECNKLCLLNNSTRNEHPDDFAETQGGVYFDTHAETPLFSVADNPLVRGGSCKELLEAGNCTSGVYTIYPEGFSSGLDVYCDMETDGGGWIMFQRRQDGSEDFYREWNQYASGFGDLSGEFWLGNENLVTLTSNRSQGKAWELRVDMEGWENNAIWAKYKDFKISGDKYSLSVGQYDASSTAGEADSLYYSRGRPFSTKDKDNDVWEWNCAESSMGAWWFEACGASHLNGRYYLSEHVGNDRGVHWYYWKGYYYSLKMCSMEIRETNT